MASIFDSDTLVVSDHSKKTSGIYLFSILIHFKYIICVLLSEVTRLFLCMSLIDSPVRERLPKVSDLKHTPQHKTAWLGEEGGGTKSVTPYRYLSKKESDSRTSK